MKEEEVLFYRKDIKFFSNVGKNNKSDFKMLIENLFFVDKLSKQKEETLLMTIVFAIINSVRTSTRNGVWVYEKLNSAWRILLWSDVKELNVFYL